jgi:hypothetical protein
MAYSCTDFADDVLNSLLDVGLIKATDIPEDDPQAQASLVISSILEATTGASAAQVFFAELLDSVETLGGVADQHGPSTLAQLLYLQTAILKGTQIDLYANEAERLGLVRALPSGERWWKHVSVLPVKG